MGIIARFGVLVEKHTNIQYNIICKTETVDSLDYLAGDYVCVHALLHVNIQ